MLIFLIQLKQINVIIFKSYHDLLIKKIRKTNCFRNKLYIVQQIFPKTRLQLYVYILYLHFLCNKLLDRFREKFGFTTKYPLKWVTMFYVMLKTFSNSFDNTCTANIHGTLLQCFPTYLNVLVHVKYEWNTIEDCFFTI